MKRLIAIPLTCALFAVQVGADETERQQALATMQSMTRFFQSEIATQGGYLWQYSHDLTRREGEGLATESMIWVQPPGTPAVGMAYLDAWEATGDSLYLQGALAAAGALVWGQLASGGWDYRINFDPAASGRWYYRRDVEAGDTDIGERRNTSIFDDNVSQSALRLLMRVDAQLEQTDDEIHGAVQYALRSFLQAQYPNGAWPQRFVELPDPDEPFVGDARYPETWSREHPQADYRDYYTFNDNAIADVIDVMLEAHRIYGDDSFRAAALRAGDFMIRAQMPEPQPVWAQQYNHNMEPAWARRFEPPSITGGESFGVLRALLDLHIETGEPRFLEPIRPAIVWARRSLLPDGRLARFYELHTNTPLYFVRDTYELTYSDADMPTHYAFKVGGLGRIEGVENALQRIEQEGRQVLLAERRQRFRGSLSTEDDEQVRTIAAAMDERGRFVEDGTMRPDERGQPRIEMQVIRCRTFVRNLQTLTRYVTLSSAP
jgi:PelA/Pel-15E family pectate lyase